MKMNTKMLEKRIEILQKIDELLLKCDCVASFESESCSNCKEITDYGRKLLRLVNKRKAKMENSKTLKKSKVTLTKEEYLALKNVNKTDKEIAKLCNVSLRTIKNWKRANNIVVERVNKKR
ncbi:hypothetical protein LAV73_06730 [Lysinibacillus xylanilyticus]|uniref:hypothetical protein n=1 Tax=Lysinibacillus xylanilyticus TaxID=582475 RepID=UPI002B243A2A|nr:hypothetical protein [Lysinibacillus xylanilyticus]MEB2279695.1 hypothetical protein [Lysinibacillus xylanilyticus]